MDSESELPLSVIMPAYNEEAAIKKAADEVEQNVLAIIPGAELIVIDDGSRDATGRILDKLAEKHAQIRVIHQPNGGHGWALRTGLDSARGKYVFLLDSDRQIPLEAFSTLWAAMPGSDAVFGIRGERHDPKLRLILTKLVRYFIHIFFKVRLRDANVPFKIFRRAIWLEARELIPEDTLAPSIFLAIYMKRRGLKIVEQEVPHRERSTGLVSIRRWKLLKFCSRALPQLLVFRRRLLN